MRRAPLFVPLVLLSTSCIATSGAEDDPPCGGDLVEDAEGYCVDPGACTPPARRTLAGTCEVPTADECADVPCDGRTRFGELCQEECLVWKFSPLTGSTPRAGACFAPLGDGRFLRFGGMEREPEDPSNPNNDRYRLPVRGEAHVLTVDADLAGSWSELPGPLPPARAYAACVALGEGRVLIFGGTDFVQRVDPPAIRRLSLDGRARDDAWLFHDGSFEEVAVPEALVGRSIPLVALLPDGGALLAGGCRGDGTRGEALQDVWRISPDGRTFTPVAYEGPELPTAGVLATLGGAIEALGGVRLAAGAGCAIVDDGLRANALSLLHGERLPLELVEEAGGPVLRADPGGWRPGVPTHRSFGSFASDADGALLMGGFFVESRPNDTSVNGVMHTYPDESCFWSDGWSCPKPPEEPTTPLDRRPESRIDAGLATDGALRLLVGGWDHNDTPRDGLWRYEPCGAEDCPMRPASP